MPVFAPLNWFRDFLRGALTLTHRFTAKLTSFFGLNKTRHRSRYHTAIVWFGLLVLSLSVTYAYAIDPPAATTANSAIANPVRHTREFRGAWVATVANIDWPSQPDLSVEAQQTELLDILDRMQELNLNALVLQVRPAGDAFYASSIEPWSYWLTDQQGRAPQPYYDPLEFAITESHKRNIELHAWFNPYRAQNASLFPLAANHMAEQFPQYAYVYGKLLWMDPGAKQVQDRTYDTIMDVVRRYDVDGIHLDDYFYPYPESGVDFPDYDTYDAYVRSGGTLSLGDWRRNNVNEMVERLHTGIQAEKPNVKFGISPFGIYRPGQPPGIDGLDQYAAIYADPKLWLQRGWVDYIAPQLYWPIDRQAQSYPVLLDWWVSNNPQNRHVYVGNYLSQLEGAGWPVEEFEDQVAITRKEADRLSLGNIFFSMKMFMRNSQGVNDVFKSSIYAQPALPPAMEWLDNQLPEPPANLQAASGRLMWDRDTSGDVRSWTLYQKQGNGWKLRQVLNANTVNVSLPSGVYAVCAVDRLANESAAATVEVKG